MATPLLNRIPDSYEVRSFSDDLKTDAEEGSFTGHASVFWNVDSYGTAVSPNAFKRTIEHKGDRIPVLFFHEPKEMIGPARTLRENDKGLYHESTAIDDGRTGSYVLAHMRGGTPMGMSFGFRTVRDRPGTADDPIDFSTANNGLEDASPGDVRIISEIELYEISVLPWTFAANSKADIANVRSVAPTRVLISSLLDDLRSGALTEDDERWPLLHQLTDAWIQRSNSGSLASNSTTPLGDVDDARRLALDVQMALAEARRMGVIEWSNSNG